MTRPLVASRFPFVSDVLPSVSLTVVFYVTATVHALAARRSMGSYIMPFRLLIGLGANQSLVRSLRGGTVVEPIKSCVGSG